ncbi:MAG: hypothetical protein ACLTMP_11810 [Eggerthella lenta]
MLASSAWSCASRIARARGRGAAAVSLGLFVRDRKATEGSPVAAPKATLRVGGVLVAAGYHDHGGHDLRRRCAGAQPDQPASQQQEALLEAAEYELASSSRPPARAARFRDGAGDRHAGRRHKSERFTGQPSERHVLAYPAGSYVQVSASSLEAGDVLFKAERVECTFDGSADRTVRIKVSGSRRLKAQEEGCSGEKPRGRPSAEARKRRLPKRLPPPRPPKSRLPPPQPSRPLPQPRRPRRAARA